MQKRIDYMHIILDKIKKKHNRLLKICTINFLKSVY